MTRLPTFCAWCCHWYSAGVRVSAPELMPAEISHGICARCFDAVLAEFMGPVQLEFPPNVYQPVGGLSFA